jgi:hypothetical protein
MTNPFIRSKAAWKFKIDTKVFLFVIILKIIKSYRTVYIRLLKVPMQHTSDMSKIQNSRGSE